MHTSHLNRGIQCPVAFICELAAFWLAKVRVRARLTVECGCPVICGIHVLVARVLCLESVGASLALESAHPVIVVVHVFVNLFLGWEGIIARITFDPLFPMAKSIHMLVSGLLAAEVAVARLALVGPHCWSLGHGSECNEERR